MNSNNQTLNAKQEELAKGVASVSKKNQSIINKASDQSLTLNMTENFSSLSHLQLNSSIAGLKKNFITTSKATITLNEDDFQQPEQKPGIVPHAKPYVSTDSSGRRLSRIERKKNKAEPQKEKKTNIHRVTKPA